MSDGEAFWQAEYARDLLKALGYAWDVDGADDDEVIGCAEQEGYTWDEDNLMWRPPEED